MTPRTLSDMIAGQEILTISPDENVRMACVAMAQHEIGALPVVADDGSLLGIISERDIIKRSIIVYRPSEDTPVRHIMTRDPVTLPPAATPKEALEVMRRGKFRHLPVCDNGRLVGIVSIRDFDVAAMADTPTQTVVPGTLGHTRINRLRASVPQRLHG